MQTEVYLGYPRAEVEVRLTQQLRASSRVGGVWSVLQNLGRSANKIPQKSRKGGSEKTLERGRRKSRKQKEKRMSKRYCARGEIARGWNQKTVSRKLRGVTMSW